MRGARKSAADFHTSGLSDMEAEPAIAKCGGLEDRSS